MYQTPACRSHWERRGLHLRPSAGWRQVLCSRWLRSAAAALVIALPQIKRITAAPVTQPLETTVSVPIRDRERTKVAKWTRDTRLSWRRRTPLTSIIIKSASKADSGLFKFYSNYGELISECSLVVNESPDDDHKLAFLTPLTATITVLLVILSAVIIVKVRGTLHICHNHHNRWLCKKFSQV